MIGKKIYNYKIVSLLGEGGMGVVYKAFDVKLERFAALKIITLNTTTFSRLMERFRREARNQARLNHPNIVSVYGFVEDRDIAGIAMEYIEGETIEQILKKEGRLSIIHSLEIIYQVLDGIDYAHTQGFIHRDLKPSNIIIDLNGDAKIMDFGISKSIDEIESITQHQSRPGTLMYMSPEQLSGNDVTVKSDLYALGITLFEMITGYYPFDSRTFYEIVDSHVNKNPPSVKEYLPDAPSDIDEIILRAMGKSNLYNFSNALEFKLEVQGLLNKLRLEEPVTISHQNDFTAIPPEKKRISIATRIGNFFLFVVFVLLAFFAYSVVKEKLAQIAEKEKNNPLTYTQDYTKNPNYVEQTDWKLLTIDPDKDLNAIYFLDNLNGFIVGSKGEVLKTINGGQSWLKLNANTNNDLHSIFFVGGKMVAVGDKGTIIRLDLASQIFDKIRTGFNETFFRVKFINDNTGFIVGTNGLILKTQDGGLTWEKISTGISENLFSIDFADERTGFIVGWNGIVLKSIDGGFTWRKFNINQRTYLRNVFFVNQFLGFIVGGEGLILRTEDGGNNWNRITVNSSSGFYKIFFENNENGMILSNRGEILKTKDAGKSWELQRVGEPVVLNDIQKLSTGKYIIVGNNGSIFNSFINVK